MPKSTPIPPHVAISVGHRRNAQGAAYGGLTEWLYNSELAPRLADALSEEGIEAVVVLRPERASYRGKGEDKVRVSPYMRQIEMVNETQALCAIDLHLDAAESEWARGRTILSSGSRGSLELCGALRGAMGLHMPASQDRGVKVRSAGENGGPFLHLTRMPAALVEPWFLSNQEDRQQIVWYQEAYIKSLVVGLKNYLSAIGALD